MTGPLLRLDARVDQVDRLLDQHLHAALLPEAALYFPPTASKLDGRVLQFPETRTLIRQLPNECHDDRRGYRSRTTTLH
jgi:hypothetical protein